jgi:phosphatidylethanolamine/phosphatidyl-N-methylethanolamine N-methyltransferase
LKFRAWASRIQPKDPNSRLPKLRSRERHEYNYNGRLAHDRGNGTHTGMANELNPRRLRLAGNAPLAFFQEFLRQPEQIGSVIPSSRFLEERLVQIASIATARLAVELGPGTGGTTRALLRALPANARLLAIEINQHFVERLGRIADPRLIVQHGSAEQIGTHLDRRGLQQPDVVLSGIPFSSMPRQLGRDILGAIWNSLAPGGRFVAYQFRGRVADLGREIMGTPEVDMELLNVPPMRVYTWRKPLNGAGSAVAGRNAAGAS